MELVEDAFSDPTSFGTESFSNSAILVSDTSASTSIGSLSSIMSLSLNSSSLVVGSSPEVTSLINWSFRADGAAMLAMD